MRRVLAAWEEHLADPYLPRRLPRRCARPASATPLRVAVLNHRLRPDTYSAGMLRLVAGFVAGRRG